MNNNLQALLSGHIIESETQARQLGGESFIEAQDGTFLGKLNPNKFDSDSIFNKFGPYGSKFSQTSIFNKFSDYGSQFSQLSPFNKFSQTPPNLFVNGQFIAFLTFNKYLTPLGDPENLLEWAETNVNRYG